MTELPAVVVATGRLAERALPGEFLEPGAADALAVPIASASEDVELRASPGTADAAALYGIDLLDWAAREGLRGTPGEAAVLNLPRLLAGRESPTWAGLPERLILLGVGDGGPTAQRRAGAALGRVTAGLRRVVTTAVQDASDGGLRAFVEGFLLAAYRPPRLGLGEGSRPAARELVLLRDAESASDVTGQLEAARVGAEATLLARRLAATPSNVKSPAWVAAEAIAQVAAAREAGSVGLTVTVRDEAWLAEHGFGGLLAVGGGSATPPRLVTVDYNPAVATGRARHVALVGKGITFDTGGLSIKAREAMVPMKTDMTGAAVVLAVALAAARVRLPHRVSAVLPLAENAVGGSSYRPGDVVRLFDGTTVEVLNTDAEGRLVLGDALGWARASLRPDVLVDVATLTGAAALGLGRRHAALFSPDAALAAALERAGADAGEPAWRLPLVAEYRAALASGVADLANVATDPHVHAGAIIAALFLEQAAIGVGQEPGGPDPVPWAHLDIAGPARAPKAEHEVAEGATGFGARLLLRWLETI